jgi:1-acyl-sn-glycerol-3-phosphate acyltransferase
VSGYRAVRVVLGPLIRAIWGTTREGAPLPPGPLVVVANHDSLLDPFFLGTGLERPLRFVAKEELWTNRLVGRILEGLGAIPVRRGRGDLEAMAEASAALGAGHVVAMFPQGTVLGSGDRPWLRGAARLAIGTGTPIVPVRIVGADRALRPGTRRLRRARVHIVVGTPMPIERGRPTIAAARDLTASVRATIASL